MINRCENCNEPTELSGSMYCNSCHAYEDSKECDYVQREFECLQCKDLFTVTLPQERSFEIYSYCRHCSRSGVPELATADGIRFHIQKLETLNIEREALGLPKVNETYINELHKCHPQKAEKNIAFAGAKEEPVYIAWDPIVSEVNRGIKKGIM